MKHAQALKTVISIAVLTALFGLESVVQAQAIDISKVPFESRAAIFQQHSQSIWVPRGNWPMPAPVKTDAGWLRIEGPGSLDFRNVMPDANDRTQAALELNGRNTSVNCGVLADPFYAGVRFGRNAEWGGEWARIVGYRFKGVTWNHVGDPIDYALVGPGEIQTSVEQESQVAVQIDSGSKPVRHAHVHDIVVRRQSKAGKGSVAVKIAACEFAEIERMADYAHRTGGRPSIVLAEGIERVAVRMSRIHGIAHWPDPASHMRQSIGRLVLEDVIDLDATHRTIAADEQDERGVQRATRDQDGASHSPGQEFESGLLHRNHAAFNAARQVRFHTSSYASSSQFAIVRPWIPFSSMAGH